MKKWIVFSVSQQKDIFGARILGDYPLDITGFPDFESASAGALKICRFLNSEREDPNWVQEHIHKLAHYIESHPGIPQENIVKVLKETALDLERP